MQRTMKGFDHLSLSGGLNTLMIGLYTFRMKYELNEGGLWDIIHLCWYYKKYGKSCSISMLGKLRYGNKTGYAAIHARVLSLQAKQLLYRDSQGYCYPTEHVLKDIYNLINPTEIIPVKPGHKKPKKK